MKITTKGRYALRIMIDLAEHNSGEYIKLCEVAQRQNISEKYLESIISNLNKGGFVTAVRGKGGGYKLVVSPDKCTVADILRCTEGSLAPVACLSVKPNICARVAECKTISVWEGLEKVVTEYLESITIADLCEKNDSIS